MRREDLRRNERVDVEGRRGFFNGMAE